ncbi:MAG: hypothetical protein M1822_004301 [Bathelium mastoideum]|nr:MAG: hypothetical protein M1822_004301 [Bathelium mastoideum]
MSQRPTLELEAYRYKGTGSTATEHTNPYEFPQNLNDSQQMPKPVVPSLLKPLDTLTNGRSNVGIPAQFRDKRSKSLGIPSMPGGAHGYLDTGSPQRDFLNGGEPPQKKRKMNSLIGPPAKHGKDDAILKGDQYKHTAHDKSVGRADTSSRQGLSRHPQCAVSQESSISSRFFGCDEWKQNNDRLDPTQNKLKAKPREMQEQSSQATNLIAGYPNSSLSPRCSPSIDLTGDDALPSQSKAQSTPPSHRLQKKLQHSENQQSKSKLALRNSGTTPKQEQERPERSFPSSRTHTLAAVEILQKFSPYKTSTPQDGNTTKMSKRTSFDDSEADVLDGPTTVSKPFGPSPQDGPHGRNNHEQQLRMEGLNLSLSSGEDELTADIPPTQFSNSGEKKTSSKPSTTKPIRPRRKEAKVWPIQSIWTFEHGEAPEPELSFRYDFQTKEFIFNTGQSRLMRDGAVFEPLQLKRIRKIVYSPEEPWLCLTGSRDGDMDYVAHIQFLTSGDLHEFVTLLNSLNKPGFHTYEKPLRHLQGLFSNHQEQRDDASARHAKQNAKARSSNNRQQPSYQDRKRAGPRHEDPNIQSPKRSRRTGNGEGTTKQESEQADSTTTPKAAEGPKIIYESYPRVSVAGADSCERRAGLRNSTRQTAPGKYSSPDGIDDILDPEKSLRKYNLGPEWDQSLIYPEAGPRRATVDFRDLQRLDEEEFLNDNLISFYLRYCEENYRVADAVDKRKIHFFSNFFYNTLTTNERGTKGFNYPAVQRWTSKVDIFNMDFIIVPINEDLHWYIAIICNLPNIPKRLIPDEPESLTDGSKANATRGELDEQLQEKRQASDFMVRTSKHNQSGTGSRSQSLSSLEHKLNGLSTESGSTDKQMPGVSTGNATAYPQSSGESEKLLTESDPTAQADDQILESSIETESKQGHQQSDSSSTRATRRSSGSTQKHTSSNPAIIILDSLGNSRGATIKNLKRYLIEEGRSRKSMAIRTHDIAGCNAPASSIPYQNNFCDCGLYLLGYVRKFLESPKYFVKMILTKKRIDFSQFDPNVMRAEIRDLLQRLHSEQKKARDETNRAKHAARTKNQAKASQAQDSRAEKRESQHRAQSLGAQKFLVSSSTTKRQEQEKPRDPDVAARDQTSIYNFSLPFPTANAELVSPPVHQNAFGAEKSQDPPFLAPAIDSASNTQVTNASSPPDIASATKQSSQVESMDDSVVFVSAGPVSKDFTSQQSQEAIALRADAQLDSDIVHQNARGLDGIVTGLVKSAFAGNSDAPTRADQIETQDETQEEAQDET